MAADPAGWFVIGAQAPGGPPGLIWSNDGDAGSLRTADRFFDGAAFVAWSGSVYQRSIGAWRDKNPEYLRPVMTRDVWNRYAQYLLVTSSLALGRKLMSSAVASGALAGADATGPWQSATISFEVMITAAAAASVMDRRHRSWRERWLFQRPAGSVTHISGSVAVCLVCGGPADPADSGQCPYCHADIATRTAGWLVTQVATTMPGVRKLGEAGDASAPSAGPPLQPPRAG